MKAGMKKGGPAGSPFLHPGAWSPLFCAYLPRIGLYSTGTQA